MSGKEQTAVRETGKTGEAVMKDRRSGIKIYRLSGEEKKKYRGSLPLFAFHMLTVCMVMSFWWNAFLEVFRMPFDTVWLYGGTAAAVVVLGAADRRYGAKTALGAVAAAAGLLWSGRDTVMELYKWIAHNREILFSAQPEGEAAFSCTAVLLAVPIVELLLIVQRTGRGKFPAGLALCAPFIAAACAGRFQTVLPSWFLIVGTAVYLASALPRVGRTGGGSLIWKRGLSVAAVCLALAFLSFHAGKLLDVGREEESGFYLRTREMLTTELVGGIRDLATRVSEETGNISEETDDLPVPAGSSEQEEEMAENMTQDTPLPESSGGELFEDPALSADEGSLDLGSLAYFSPSRGTSGILELEQMPEDTVYLPESWGVRYSDNTWETTDRWPDGQAGRELTDECGIIPPELKGTLMELCGEWTGEPLDTVSPEISRELDGRAVYDTNPGATPAGKDFVEYFLFENQRGFCVHFATAATLMYRYCGYTARYTSGYAIPPSAFRKNESGKYEAQLTGEMGHAWCQVYNEDTGEWMDMEHTPPSPDDSSIQPPAASVDREEIVAGQGVSRKPSVFPAFVPAWFPPVLAAVVLCALLFFVQAAVRTALRDHGFHRKNGKEGIRRMYEAVIKTARFQGADIREELEETVPGELYRQYPELPEEEWRWMYDCVMESLFYHPVSEKKDWDRMRSLYARFRKIALGRMNRRQRWIYRYIRCL